MSWERMSEERMTWEIVERRIENIVEKL
jgi:hypothetical protein